MLHASGHCGPNPLQFPTRADSSEGRARTVADAIALPRGIRQGGKDALRRTSARGAAPQRGLTAWRPRARRQSPAVAALWSITGVAWAAFDVVGKKV